MSKDTLAVKIEEVKSYWAEICIAGPIEMAKQVIRIHLSEVGLCVTLTPTTYLYTHGEEEGYIVRLINYPRFPTTPEVIKEKALALAQLLMTSTGQGSFTLVSPDTTEFYSRRAVDLKK
jgi:hypothetical protein